MRLALTITAILGSLTMVGCAGAKKTIDLGPALAQAKARPEMAASPQKVAATGLLVQNRTADPKLFGDTLSMNLVTGYAPDKAQSSRDLTEVIHDAVSDALVSKGVDVTSPSPPSTTVTVLIDRMEMKFTDKEMQRDAFFEGMLTVSRGNSEQYSRKLTIQARRQFGDAGSGVAAFVSMGAGTIMHAKEEREGVRSLWAELFGKLEDEIRSDGDLMKALAQ